MRKHIHYTLLVLLGSAAALAQNGAVQSHVSPLMRQRLQTISSAYQLATSSGVIQLSPELISFYHRNGFTPVWSDMRGLAPCADSLLRAIASAADHGLDPETYHWQAVTHLFARARKHFTTLMIDPELLAEIDILLTDAYMLYGKHLHAGRYNPHELDAEWYLLKTGADMKVNLLEASGAGTLCESIAALPSPQPEYVRLKEALARYRRLAQQGGWPAVPEGKKLEKGMWDERVMALRARLRVTGELGQEPAPVEGTFDDRLVNAVRRFQIAHGLDPDGKVGAATLAALNITVEERIRQLMINLERWRWLPRQPGERHIRVNIADFTLEVVERDSVALFMRVVVGKTYRRTPVFSDRMTYLVLNPYWNIPTTILLNDIVPKAQKNPDYLRSENIRVFQGWSAQAPEIDPATIDWKKLSKNYLPYRFRQDPGAKNALGRIKFMFPNQFDVYLHDTPSHSLFNRSRRDFSSGCIRIEKPVDLALYLLNDPQWTRERMEKLFTTRIETTLPVRRPILVELIYLTAWVDEAGVVQFRQDIYERDKNFPIKAPKPASLAFLSHP